MWSPAKLNGSPRSESRGRLEVVEPRGALDVRLLGGLASQSSSASWSGRTTQIRGSPLAPDLERSVAAEPHHVLNVDVEVGLALLQRHLQVSDHNHAVTLGEPAGVLNESVGDFGREPHGLGVLLGRLLDGHTESVASAAKLVVDLEIGTKVSSESRLESEHVFVPLAVYRAP